MSLNRFAARRDQTERPIIDALRAVGALVKQQDFPDLLVRFRGQIYLLEVDGVTRSRKRKPKQLEFLRTWQIPVVKTASQALAVCGISCDC